MKVLRISSWSTSSRNSPGQSSNPNRYYLRWHQLLESARGQLIPNKKERENLSKPPRPLLRITGQSKISKKSLEVGSTDIIILNLTITLRGSEISMLQTKISLSPGGISLCRLRNKEILGLPVITNFLSQWLSLSQGIAVNLITVVKRCTWTQRITIKCRLTKITMLFISSLRTDHGKLIVGFKAPHLLTSGWILIILTAFYIARNQVQSKFA